MKTCWRCKEIKPLEAFWKQTKSKDGFQSACKLCQQEHDRIWRKENPSKVKAIAKRNGRKERLKRLFGLTVEGYEKLLQEQGGACKICGGDDQSGKRLAVDHDHQTGKIRGLLCRHCNMALGLLDDSTERLRAALDYLENRDLTKRTP